MATGSWTGTSPRGVYKPAMNEKEGTADAGAWKDFDTSLTNIHNKLWRDAKVNVKSDYGATGDGSTDDTTAIQNAIDALSSGGTVFFPPGIYKITSTLTLADYITLEGTNQEASEILIAGNVWGITISGKEYISIRDLQIKANISCTGGITIASSSGFIDMENLLIMGESNMTDGIKIDTSHWSMLKNCRVRDQTGKSLWVISANNTHVYGGYYGVSAYALYLDTSESCLFSNVDFAGATTTGVYAKGNLAGNVFLAPRIERGTAGAGTGMDLASCADLTVIGGTIVEYTTAVVAFGASTTNCFFRGTYIDNTSGNITFNATSYNNKFENCLLTDITGITYGGKWNEFENCRNATEITTRELSSDGRSTINVVGDGTACNPDRYHDTIIVDSLTANTTITLPDAATVPRGKQYTIKLQAVSSYAVTIARTSSQTIDGVDADLTLDRDYDTVTLQQFNEDRWFIVGEYKYGLHQGENKKIERTASSVDLSGAAATLVCFHAERACTLEKATLLYTEASSADAGITVEIGKESDRDYYYTGTTEVSKSQWYTKDVTLLQTDIASGDTVTFYSAGSKTGTGEIMLVIEYTID
jgi:hypothetical protein